MVLICKYINIKYIKLSCTEATLNKSEEVRLSSWSSLPGPLQVDVHPPQASSPSAEARGADQEDSQLSLGCLASVLTH